METGKNVILPVGPAVAAEREDRPYLDNTPPTLLVSAGAGIAVIVTAYPAYPAYPVRPAEAEWCSRPARHTCLVVAEEKEVESQRTLIVLGLLAAT